MKLRAIFLLTKSTIIKNLFFFPILLLFVVGQAQRPLVITANSKSDYSIVIRPDATNMEKHAADVLQTNLFKVAQCRLPIVTQEKPSTVKQIIIGRTTKLSAADTKGIELDAVLIKSENNSLILTGGNRKGVLYAVYTFLEDFVGCQAYSAKLIDIPRKNTISIPTPINVRQVPSFAYRMMFFPDIRNNEYADWRKVSYFYEDWGLWVHSFATLLPEKEYFASHPEYFALVNGKRNPAQLDPSNPAVIKIVVQNLKKLIDAKPGVKFWSVSQNDNQEYCHCAACNRINTQQESPQGALLSFVNAVAKNFPNQIITSLAYGYSEKPPKTLVPEKNVMIMLTASSITDRRKSITTQSPGLQQSFKKWSRISNHLLVWDYVVQFEHTTLPFPNLNSLQPNMRYFASGNTDYMFIQGTGDIVGEFSELKCHLLSKLMWNKDINVPLTVKQFLTNFYGQKGGAYVQQYLDLLQKEANASSAPLYTSGTLKGALSSYLSVDKIRSYKAIFQKAFTEVDSKTIYGKRLSKEYATLLYAELENLQPNAGNQQTSRSAPRTNTKEILNEWYKRVKEADIQYLNEARMGIDDYYNTYAAKLN
ncbi:DUF4838 domain-containing protein [Segetibacter sp. 3557_3]|uniref:DUF4838 domain-containing protein n=1 Tax=Segetibacter sp. 3557_3 TaxID=2547429 RepID=UPI001058DB3B|nr:DUF4838 domain-containing protein [Segetibacter sp. 3557_3]TDH23329.1 DUF4838 domain-containing protein [Segetibacter sp. 3557_3]